ncbi:MAG: thiolase family protein [Casimicrobiaceae bacterium]
MGRNVYITGVGFHPFGKHPDRTLKSLAATAALAALDDAGLDPRAVDAGFCGNAYGGLLTGQESIRGQTWLRSIGLGSIPMLNIENACASGGSAAHLAFMGVASGSYDHVLVIGAEKMFVGDTARTIRALASSADLEMTGDIGLQFAAVDAIRVAKVMEEEGLDASDLEDVTVKSHDNGALNPIAHYQKRMSAAEVRASRMIAEPLRLMMCSAISDGAAAVVLSATPGPGRVRVRASALASSPVRGRVGDRTTAELAVARAYADAGIGPQDVDFAEVHDAVSPAEFLYYRELGFCAPGDVKAFARAGRARLGGDKPVNPSGGLNSRGHPVAATGIAQLAEATLQLRGTAGARQVEGARIGLTHNAGGWIDRDPAICAIHILEREA